MIKALEFDINQILKETPANIVGKEIVDYGNIYVATFHENNNQYEIYAFYDVDTDVKGVCVVLDGMIINEI